MLKRAIWPSVDFRSLDGEISESKGKHALHRGAVGKVRASSRRLRKCFFLFSYSCYMSLKQTFSIAKLQQHPICGKAHMVGAYSFIYRWSQLSCMSFTFCLRCDVWPVIVRSDLCCGSESVLGVVGQMRPSIRGVWSSTCWAAPSSLCCVKLQWASTPSACFRPALLFDGH